MTGVDVSTIAKLRQRTGVGVAAAKRALETAAGDFDRAIEILRKSGQKVADSKLGRATREGLVGHYVHVNGKIAALVVVTCETDFVARSEAFQTLAHDLALHVAAANPRFLRPEDVPAEVVAKEQEIYREQLTADRKPAAVLEKIVAGKLEKFFEETCLLRQRFVRDENLTVAQLVSTAVQQLGENIQIREFIRLSV
ncbi:MAG: elongation factor Ts [Candidatus Kerfeldbacteria bacterium]|nr:elongation factor Ts [Candidatus Kerfeldbacteria bacterium]